MNLLLIILIGLILYYLFFSEDKKCYKVKNNIENFTASNTTPNSPPVSSTSHDNILRKIFDNVLIDSKHFFKPKYESPTGSPTGSSIEESTTGSSTVQSTV